MKTVGAVDRAPRREVRTKLGKRVCVMMLQQRKMEIQCWLALISVMWETKPLAEREGHCTGSLWSLRMITV